MDFATAFDKVSHSLLTHKLQHYGITGKINNWIHSFLSNRRQAVVNGATSTFVHVESGVPQGSDLDPCLFLLYINDLPKGVTSTTRQVVDVEEVECWAQTDPWRTPDSIGTAFEEAPSTTTVCCWSSRKFLIHARICPEIP